jgi:hypothetical protein
VEDGVQKIAIRGDYEIETGVSTVLGQASMKTEQYHCDVCARPKLQTNHWYKVRIGEAFHAYHWDFDREGAMDESLAIKHVCSQECLMKIMQQGFLDSPQTSSTIGGKSQGQTKENSPS